MNREEVGDFYVHLVRSPYEVDRELTSSNKLLRGGETIIDVNGNTIVRKKPTVIHFYDGG